MNKALAGDLPPAERSRLEAAGREIGWIVYTLYTLPAEEIAVVDGPAFWAARIRWRFLACNEGWAAENYRCTAMGS